MIFEALREKAKHYPLFTVNDCAKWFPCDDRATLLVQLSGYAKRSKIERLKRGLYALLDGESMDPFLLSSRIDPGAIVSLESVLAQAQIIPETVFGVTAVTTGKTRTLDCGRFGTVRFRHIKPTLDFGWRNVPVGQYAVRIASPEKALLDLFWYHRYEDPSAYVSELRLTLPDTFSRDTFRRYANLFASKEVDNFVTHLSTLA